MRGIDTSAGQLRTRVMIQRLKSTLSEDSSGHVDETADANFVDHEKRWCQMIFARGNERLVGDLQTGFQRALVRMRYDKLTGTQLSTADRIKVIETGAIYSIAEPPVDVDGNRKMVEFVVARKVV